MVAKRGQNIKLFMGQQQAPESDENRFWSNLSGRVSSGQVIPIISSGLVYDLVFQQALITDGDAPTEELDSPQAKMTVLNLLALTWAMEQGFPFPENEDLARVAQYALSRARASGEAKEEYLNFLKNSLLHYAEQTGVDKGQVDDLRAGLSEYSFGDLAVQELELVKFGVGCTDPLSVLAGLPLPIYITTSAHDLLERALVAMGKQPVTQICFWSGAVTSLPDEHKPLDVFEPTPQRPLVYHLYGLDRYPTTLVLGEDDYLDFLVELTLERSTTHIIPGYLQSALSVSCLMLLGYRMTDWDFRTLFRGLNATRGKKNATFMSTILQLSLTDQYELPAGGSIRDNLVLAQKYLQDYFTPQAFEIRWGAPAEFLNRLQKEWHERRQR